MVMYYIDVLYNNCDKLNILKEQQISKEWSTEEDELGT